MKIKVLVLLIVATVTISIKMQNKIKMKARSKNKMKHKLKIVNAVNNVAKVVKVTKQIQQMKSDQNVQDISLDSELVNLGESYLSKKKKKTNKQKEVKMGSKPNSNNTNINIKPNSNNTNSSNSKESIIMFRRICRSDDEVSESPLQVGQLNMNENNVYFSNPHNKQYLDIIGGIELSKVFDKTQDSEDKCCHQINKVHKYIYNNGKYIGYCFNLNMEQEEWMMCWDDQIAAKTLRNKIIDQIIINIKKDKKQ